MSVHAERPLSCTCPPLSHARSPIGTKHHFSAVKISLQQTSCPPTAIAVDDLDDGAVFCQQLQQFDGSFQRGRRPTIGVQYGRIPRGTSRDFFCGLSSLPARLVSLRAGRLRLSREPPLSRIGPITWRTRCPIHSHFSPRVHPSMQPRQSASPFSSFGPEHVSWD